MYHYNNDPSSEVMPSDSSTETLIEISDLSANGTNNASSLNASTSKSEQQNGGFYKSYDPSLGLHTAAVLGGILVWLVLYVIYRTKIRKCVIRAMKRKFGSLEDLSPKNVIGVNDSDINSSSGATNPNATRPLINPSIVIETSPPESSPKSPSTYDQFFKPGGGNDCLSSHSLPGVVNDDGMIFQFPCVHNHSNPYHCADQHDYVQQQPYRSQLPKSELDIPNATAQWVQSMPLAARSYQDFTGLMLNMHNQGFLTLTKPCSCPHVCVTPTTQLPVLDMPFAWNNSLPVLSNSFSNRFLDACEPRNKHKDMKDLINAKRKLSCSLKSEQDSLNDKILQKMDSNRLSIKRSGNLSKKNEQRHSGKKKTSKNPANLTIKIPDSKETATLINNNAYSRSPIPIPVTPTVMIQNTTKAPNRRRGCHDSNTSISSSSSNDLLHGATNLPPPIHITVADPSQKNSYHLSAACSDRLRSAGCSASGCHDAGKENSHASNQGRVSPACYSPYHFIASHCQCSFKHSRNDNDRLHRQNSIGECHFSRKPKNDNFLGGYPSVFHHRRSLSDYNNRHGHLSPTFHQRSLSADISAGYGTQRDQQSQANSPYASNKNSPGATAPSPNLLQVPDMNNGMKERPFFLDVNPSSVYSSSNSLYHSTNNHNNNNSGGSQYFFRHGGTSDSNIAYYRGSHRPVSPLVDIPKDRRHSSIIPASTGSQLLYCSDGNPSPRSSSYFLPLQAMPMLPTCSQSQHPNPPQPQPHVHTTSEEERHQLQPEQEQPSIAPPVQNRSNNPCNVSNDAAQNQNLVGTPVVSKSVMMETKL